MNRSLPKGKAIANVARVLMVASAKGGVGKSTVAVNLAVSMARLGKRVGLLDADLYGPSLPGLMAIPPGSLQPSNDSMLHPIMKHGIWNMSMGLLVKAEEGLAWRGLILMRALQQLLFEVKWPNETDWLIIDMPPGTGDALLSVVQEVKPIWGSLIVTTGHPIALADVQRGMRVLEKMHVPLRGLINNLSHLQCSCGHTHQLAGNQDHLRSFMDQHPSLPLLGTLPLATEQVDANERGIPMPISYPHHPLTQLYLQIAQQLINT